MINVLLEEEECCCICQHTLTSKPILTLDCSHVFHSACIISWFRSPRDYPDEAGTCPLCRSVPITVLMGWETDLRARVNVLKRLARKKNNVPVPILKAIQRLRDAEKISAEKIKELNVFLKLSEVKKWKKKYGQLRSNRWKARRKVSQRRRELVQFDPLACINFFA